MIHTDLQSNKSVKRCRQLLGGILLLLIAMPCGSAEAAAIIERNICWSPTGISDPAEKACNFNKFFTHRNCPQKGKYTDLFLYLRESGEVGFPLLDPPPTCERCCTPEGEKIIGRWPDGRKMEVLYKTLSVDQPVTIILTNPSGVRMTGDGLFKPMERWTK
jgi:hypothetical protein